MQQAEYIIIGSGPSGAMAAQTLVEAGKDVLMLDVGEIDQKYQHLVPDKDFLSIRRNESNQNRYLIGDEFEGIPNDDIKVGAQLTPSRKAMIRGVEELTPLISDTFLPMESLGYGGLGTGWGLGAYVYSDAELSKAGLDIDEMRKAYQVVSDRIGISVGNDELRNYIADGLINTQSPLKPDNSIQKMLDKYQKKKNWFRKHRIVAGHPVMAFLSEDLKDRKATAYHDMDFYADNGKSAWRSWYTIDELKQKPNFNYLDKNLVLKFEEKDDKAVVSAKNTITNEVSNFECKKLIISASPLGTARIVLRSIDNENLSLPLLCNPYTYMPCINLQMLGKELDTFKTSMAQAMMVYDVTGNHDDLVSIAFFTYRSLLLQRIIKEAPLNFADGRKVMQYLQSAFVIAGIHHPDDPTDKKYLELRKNDSSFTGDHLFAHYDLSEMEKDKIKVREKVVKKAFRKMGCIPVKRLDPGYGSSIHYGGTLPYSSEPKPGTLSKNGKLYGFNKVYVADGSGFKHLPAKGITLSLMANAHRTMLKIIAAE